MTDDAPKKSRAKAPKRDAGKGADQEAPRFDASLGRLEEIVAELEQGGLGLEESLAQYKEGVDLLKGCRTQLMSFRAQVEELTAQGIKPHDRDPDVQGQGAGPAAGRGPAPRGGGSSTGSGGIPIDVDAPF